MNMLLSRIKRWWLVVFLALSVGYVVYYLGNEITHSRASVRLEPAWLIGAGFFHAMFLLLASSNWCRIVQSSTGLSLSVYEGFRQIAVVSLGKYLPGKVWGAIARGAVLTKLGVRARSVILATFHEQYLLVVSGVAVFVLCLAPLLGMPWMLVAGVCGGAVAALGFYAQAVGFRVVGRFSAKDEVSDVGDTVGFAWQLYIRLIARFVLLWILNGLIFTCLCYALFPGPLTLDRVTILILANTAGITAGFFALFAPGGIGVREAVSSAILTGMMPFADALMLGVVFRVWVTAIELVSSLTLIPYFQMRNRTSEI
jgi:hypothetical protein